MRNIGANYRYLPEMKTSAALHNYQSPIEPILPENREDSGTALPDTPLAPGKKQSRKLIVLLMLAAGCVYTYYTLPDAGRTMEPGARDQRQAEPLQDQYSKYLKAIEAAKSVTSSDSLPIGHDSINPKP